MIRTKFMMYVGFCVILALSGERFAASQAAQTSHDNFHDAVGRAAELSTLTSSNSAPFHLKLAAHDVTLKNPEYDAEIELWWESPDKWRRNVKSPSFGQIAIQNGLHYYESNSSTDYLPYWLDALIRGSVAPIPVPALANVSADEDRPGCGNWEISHGSGDEMFSSYASMCFNPDGTAREIFADPIGFTFADYQKFGNKRIARRLSVWPGDRSEVTATITALESLEQWEPSGSGTPISRLFDVPEDTGLASRVRFVSVPESALTPSESALRAPLNWPSSYTFPTSGVIAVRIQIDRFGNVREFPSAISKNQAINAGAVAQIRNWKFKPYIVDGSPVEVVTTLHIPFHLKYEPLGANGKEFPSISFRDHMKQYRALSDLRAEGGKPFHLCASFIMGGGQAGKYEETWHSPDEWVRQVELEGGTLRETRTSGHTTTKFDGNNRGGAAMRAVLAAMLDRLPEMRTFQEADWGNSAVPVSNVYPFKGNDSSEPVLIRAARGAVDANNHPTSGQAYWFDSDGLLRASFADGMTVVNSDFSLWNQKTISRHIEFFIGITLAAVVTVNTIEVQ